MLCQESKIRVSDNTGARKALIIRVLGSSKRYANIGDKVVVTIKESISNGNVKKGQIFKAVIIRTKKKIKRKDGSYISFNENSCILIDESGEIKGTRIFGPVPRELREMKYTKIISLAKEVV